MNKNLLSIGMERMMVIKANMRVNKILSGGGRSWHGGF
jgi:hypothetical protein